MDRIKHFFPYSKINKSLNLKDFKNYIHFHFDNKWKNYDNKYLNNIIKKIYQISTHKKIIITSDIKNIYLEQFNSVNTNIMVIRDTTVQDLIYIVKNCEILISMHSGLLVHLSFCFNKNVIDVLSQDKFNEIDRWIPNYESYKRFSLDDIDKIKIIDAHL